jgi:HEAT repeat protein
MSARRNHLGYDRVASTLEHLGVSDPIELIPLLQSPNKRWAATACSALGFTGKKAFGTVLLAVLKGKRPSLWMPAAVAISQLESKRTIRALIQLMLDPSRSARQRQAVAYALSFTWGGLADERYMTSTGEAFIRILQNQHESPGLRGQVAEGLAYLHGPCAGAARDRRRRAYREAGQILITSLGDPSAEVRFWSAFALGSMRYRMALPMLRKVARTDKGRFGNWWTVGEEAADAVACINGQPRPIRIGSGS